MRSYCWSLVRNQIHAAASGRVQSKAKMVPRWATVERQGRPPQLRERLRKLRKWIPSGESEWNFVHTHWKEMCFVWITHAFFSASFVSLSISCTADYFFVLRLLLQVLIVKNQKVGRNLRCVFQHIIVATHRSQICIHGTDIEGIIFVLEIFTLLLTSVVWSKPRLVVLAIRTVGQTMTPICLQSIGGSVAGYSKLAGCELVLQRRCR